MARLVPQLSSTAAAPDRAALGSPLPRRPARCSSPRLTSNPGEIVGSLTLVSYRIPTGLHAVIEDVVVDESARGHGVGAALVFEAVWLAPASRAPGTSA